MKEIQYKNFSFKRHTNALGQDKASVCQFELTYGCDLHCRHCYTDCYNKPDDQVKELENLIADTARKILNLDFQSCGKVDCEWCALARVSLL